MALWRDDTHWYRPIRLTDERRFLRAMHVGWIAVGALPPDPPLAALNLSVYDEVLRHYYRPHTRLPLRCRRRQS